MEVTMDDKIIPEKFESMTLEEKLTLLSDTEKAYICGYIDRAVLEQRTKNNEELRMRKEEKTSRRDAETRRNKE
jgi:hypothetical protein